MNLQPHTWALITLVVSALVLGIQAAMQLITRRRREPRPAIRPLPAFQDLMNEVKLAAESGKTIHVALGSGGLNGENAVTSLAALQVVEALAEIAVSYNVPPIVTVGDPTLLPLAQDVLRRACERLSLADMYRSDWVRFVAPSPVAYAAGAANVVAAEGVTASVMAGDFGVEVSLIADAAARRDLPQLAAAADLRAIAALYPATDRLAVGEELYAAGAEMTGAQRYLVSLKAQDWLRLILAAVILIAAGLAFLGGLETP